ncbi:MAG: DUF808 domain-containing protein [Xanthomonadaceae bacterium]|nr:DUF808 domain-containing protein [Xanthomonadaceae bacterium]HRQ35390.1 DUF808 domain-containing protein [Chiayiivirga sp.]
MAGASLLTLLDDIATLLDDVAAMTKAAAAKTSGVLGDDLAVNAEQVSGVRASRELPVVWAVAKGSLVNKAILVPSALAISAFAPWAVNLLLMAGGAFLSFEATEKLLHKAPSQSHEAEPVPGDESIEELERRKIRGAIRTDFILSAEIIVITLGTVADAAFSRQLGVLIMMAVLMTVGVYGLVGGIVKMDDAGLALQSRRGDGPGARMARGIGRLLLALAPRMMKGLSFAGMVAMFLVGGSLLLHGIAPLHHLVESLAVALGGFGWIVRLLANAAVGLVAGCVILGVTRIVGRLRARG